MAQLLGRRTRRRARSCLVVRVGGDGGCLSRRRGSKEVDELWVLLKGRARGRRRRDRPGGDGDLVEACAVERREKKMRLEMLVAAIAWGRTGGKRD